MLDLRNLTVVEEKWLYPCTLDQKDAAERLGISDRYLRELEEYYPPRTVNGSGHESEYEWPALMFWFLEYQIARASNDEWAFDQWWDRVRLQRRLDKMERLANDLITMMKRAGVSAAIIRNAQGMLSIEE